MTQIELTGRESLDLKNILEHAKNEVQWELARSEINEPVNHKWKARARLELQSIDSILGSL